MTSFEIDRHPRMWALRIRDVKWWPLKEVNARLEEIACGIESDGVCPELSPFPYGPEYNDCPCERPVGHGGLHGAYGHDQPFEKELLETWKKLP